MISEFPLFLFTTFTGLAAGAYLVSVFFPSTRQGKSAWLLQLSCIILLAVGAICVWFHLGHMERVLNALANPTSPITEEAYWSIFLGIILLIEVILLKFKGASSQALQIIGAVAAIGLLCVTGNAYFTSHAVAVWGTPFTFLLFIFGDLLYGAALVATFRSDLCTNRAFVILYLVSAVLAAIGIIGVAAAFAHADLEWIPFIVALVVGPCASAVCIVAARNSKNGLALASGAFVLAVIGVVIARYFFYTASIL
jgi:anaerobic dimethyl sulfoxide reductase subunit C (anchor subunit)